MTRLKILLLCLILTLAGGACGLKGPLYLPETSDTASPASEESEEETDDEGNETRP